MEIEAVCTPVFDADRLILAQSCDGTLVWVVIADCSPTYVYLCDLTPDEQTHVVCFADNPWSVEPPYHV